MTPSAVRFFGVLPVAFALALGGCGDDSDSSFNPGPTTVDTVAPAVPVNVQATATLGGGPASIQVEWDGNSEPDLAGYVLQRSLDRGATWTTLTVTPLATASYDDVYYSRADYRVAAVDFSDNESAFSTPGAWIYIPHDSGKNPSKAAEQSF
ncbi:MAG TPA: fibronectin type III domain-containing protein [bacterium]|nr:fibronectin type III domain-containing protein [bacterium]